MIVYQSLESSLSLEIIEIRLFSRNIFNLISMLDCCKKSFKPLQWEQLVGVKRSRRNMLDRRFSVFWK